MKKIDDVNLEQEWLEFVGELDQGRITNIPDAGDQAWAHILDPVRRHGLSLPWESHPDFEFRLRGKEVTIWAGYNGSGKTAILGQIMSHLVTEHQQKVCVASFEMPSTALVLRHVQQIMGRAPERQDEAAFWEALAPFDDQYFLYEQKDAINPERVYGMISYAAKAYGCKHFVVDSFVKCNVPHKPTYNEACRQFIDCLQVLAKRLDVHIHLVCHLRKPLDTGKVPTRFDLKYAGELADLADNVVILYRNEPKERGESTNLQQDAALIVDKQRHPAGTGMLFLDFDAKSNTWKQPRGGW